MTSACQAAPTISVVATAEFFTWHGRDEPTDILGALARDPDLRDHLTGRGYQRTRQFGWANTVKQMPEVQKSELMTFC